MKLASLEDLYVDELARLLGHNDAADLLQKTLDEEGPADKAPTELAETSFNIGAYDADGRN